jgi:hypothetical protein
MDGDGEMYSIRYLLTPASGTLWSAVARYTKINQGGVEPDTRHSIAPGPEEWWSVDVAHRRDTPFGEVESESARTPATANGMTAMRTCFAPT